MPARISDLTIEHLGTRTTEADLTEFRRACHNYARINEVSEQDAIDAIWNDGDCAENVAEWGGRTESRQEYLADLWSRLDDLPGTAHRPLIVEDETGANIAGAQVRLVNDSQWLYVDDVDGYQIIPSTEIGPLLRYARPI